MSRTLSRIVTSAAATGCLVAAMVAVPASAPAAPSCPATDAVCQYSGLAFTGSTDIDRNPSVNTCTPVNFPGPDTAFAHSVRNRTAHVLVEFLDDNCTVPAGASVQPFSDQPAGNYGSYLLDFAG
ncbi:hypothetical protein [Streptomyces sp. NPDC053048]|uniref:hypothetical protein n=1 Tax=Streptomyces sp. NPDC053048 TaxID=3365694 RepID=UPI0037D7ECCD